MTFAHAERALPSGSFEVQLQRNGRYEEPSIVTLSGVVDLLRSLEGQPDVNLSVTDRGSKASLILAVDGPRWCIGAEDGNDLSEFVRDAGSDEKVVLLIGLQTTPIEERRTLDFVAALRVAETWLKRSAPARVPGIGHWRTA